MHGGVVSVLPVGSNLFFVDELGASYNWYAFNTARRSLGWNNRLLSYAYVGRLTLEMTGDSHRSTVVLSSEVERPVVQTILNGSIRAQFDLGSRTSLAGGLTLRQTRYDTSGLSDVDAASVPKLEGSDTVASLGLRYRLGSRFVLGGDLERSQFNFLQESQLRNSTGTGYIGTIEYLGTGFTANVYAGLRELEGGADSAFPRFRGASGGARIGFPLLRIARLELIGTRTLENSLFQGNPYFVQDRYGASLTIGLRKFRVIAGVERGSNDYEVAVNTANASEVRRRDHVTTLRGGIDFPVILRARLKVHAYQSTYTSNMPGFDRTISGVSTDFSLSFGFTLGLLGDRELIR
jgi:hypothetical protein